jgi:GNAT superfamily N-acetyltransferase
VIEITEQPFSEGLKKQIFDGFSSHALATIGHDEKFDSLAFVAMDGNAVIGSVVVESFWGALHIKLMYVEEAYRNKGVGRRLMERALAYGVKKVFMPSLQDSVFIPHTPRPPFAALTATWAMTFRSFGPQNHA